MSGGDVRFLFQINGVYPQENNFSLSGALLDDGWSLIFEISNDRITNATAKPHPSLAKEDALRATNRILGELNLDLSRFWTFYVPPFGGAIDQGQREVIGLVVQANRFGRHIS